MREVNPLARPLVTQGAGGQSVASGLSLGAALGLTYLLHRTQHHTAERIAVRLLIAGEGAVVLTILQNCASPDPENFER
jgi:hypothetical protein